MRQQRLDIVSRNYPYLVAECAGEVVGYAYASPYRLRPAYRYTAENSITCTRHGLVGALVDS
jgi:phosphinothricin acetyltransferase